MTGRRLLVLRHGRTAWNLVDRAQGHTDIALDETGHEQAAAAAAALAAYQPSVLIGSDLARARQTTEHVAAATGLEPSFDRRLRELDVGTNRAGLTLAEYAVAHPVEHEHLVTGRDHLIPGRESIADGAERLCDVLHELVGALAEDGVAVAVSHGAVMRAGLMAFVGLPRSAVNAFVTLDNCAWVDLVEGTSVWDGGEPRWRIAGWNLRAPVG